MPSDTLGNHPLYMPHFQIQCLVSQPIAIPGSEPAPLEDADDEEAEGAYDEECPESEPEESDPVVEVNPKDTRSNVHLFFV